eukprot:SAG31_NODE_9450_length_1275_cov_1.510204_2_plen_337_part_00
MCYPALSAPRQLQSAVFASPGYPADTDVSALCKLIGSELARVLDDAALLRLTMDTAVDVVNELSTRLQNEAITSKDAFQLSGHINNSQLKNAQLFNAMNTLQRHVSTTFQISTEKAVALAAEDSASRDGIDSAADREHVKVGKELAATVDDAILAMVERLFVVFSSTLESKIFGMHQQTFTEQSAAGSVSGGGSAPTMPCSRYMADFCEHFKFVSKLLGHYDGSAAIFHRKVVALVVRLVEFNTRHLALLGTYRKVLPKAQRSVSLCSHQTCRLLCWLHMCSPAFQLKVLVCLLQRCFACRYGAIRACIGTSTVPQGTRMYSDPKNATRVPSATVL